MSIYPLYLVHSLSSLFVFFFVFSFFFFYRQLQLFFFFWLLLKCVRPFPFFLHLIYGRRMYGKRWRKESARFLLFLFLSCSTYSFLWVFCFFPLLHYIYIYIYIYTHTSLMRPLLPSLLLLYSCGCVCVCVWSYGRLNFGSFFFFFDLDAMLHLLLFFFLYFSPREGVQRQKKKRDTEKKKKWLLCVVFWQHLQDFASLLVFCFFFSGAEGQRLNMEERPEVRCDSDLTKPAEVHNSPTFNKRCWFSPYIYMSSQGVIYGRTPRVASVYLQAAPSPSFFFFFFYERSKKKKKRNSWELISAITSRSCSKNIISWKLLFFFLLERVSGTHTLTHVCTSSPPLFSSSFLTFTSFFFRL